jgi:predicted nucleic acid-binding protein
MICIKEIVSLAREHRLSTYEASYLDLAMRLDLPLSTRTTALVKVAGKIQSPRSPANPLPMKSQN